MLSSFGQLRSLSIHPTIASSLSALSRLHQLQSLHITGRLIRLRGYQCTGLAVLTQLMQLRLDSSLLPRHLQDLVHLTGLTELQVASQGCTSEVMVSLLQPLKQLRRLQLESECSFLAQHIAHLAASCPLLIHLDLRRVLVDFADTEPALPWFPHLTSLCLHMEFNRQLDQLGQWPEPNPLSRQLLPLLGLRHLKIETNVTDEVMTAIACCKRLQSLNLQFLGKDCAAGLVLLGHLTSLTNLEMIMDTNDFSDVLHPGVQQALVSLPNLRKLKLVSMLAGCGLQGNDILQWLTQLTGLRQLAVWLHEEPVVTSLKAAMEQVVPWCKVSYGW